MHEPPHMHTHIHTIPQLGDFYPQTQNGVCVYVHEHEHPAHQKRGPSAQTWAWLAGFSVLCVSVCARVRVPGYRQLVEARSWCSTELVPCPVSQYVYLF